MDYFEQVGDKLEDFRMDALESPEKGRFVTFEEFVGLLSDLERAMESAITAEDLSELENDLNSEIVDLENDLSDAHGDNSDLHDTIEELQDLIDDLENQLNDANQDQ